MPQASSPLGDYLRTQLRQRSDAEGRPWSLRELARRAGLSHGTVSLIMRAQVTPETATLERIADALGITLGDLLVASGLQESVTVDPTAQYIARRLSELPEWLREPALEGIGALVDQFSQIAAQHLQEPREPPSASTAQRHVFHDTNEREGTVGEGGGASVNLSEEVVAILAIAYSIIERQESMGNKKPDQPQPPSDTRAFTEALQQLKEAAPEAFEKIKKAAAQNQTTNAQARTGC